ncbi:DUF4350 domain-containing protein [Nocardioides sp. LHG3406-4]|uniref:DUF4350 domain-containing protein n=1 Tax=Nocardioides sp. LHG3406-4 TaxID=2804575 RepID=UPI003CED9188
MSGARSQRWQGHRSTLLIAGGLLAALAVVLLLGTPGARTAARLDPDNPGTEGAQALARVLADQGVDVSVTRDADSFDEALVDAGTTVLVTSSEQLGDSTTRRLLDHAAPGQLVVSEPGIGAVEAMGLDALPVRVTPPGEVEAGCAEPGLADLEISIDSGLAFEGDGCFPTAEGRLLARPTEQVALLGAGDLLTNDQILRADNAAAAVRLLGERPRLVWYVPTYADLVGDDGVSVRSLLPSWLIPAVWLLGLSTIALMLWRGRRLGPLATEPLPVVVKAVETTQSRGRLYHRVGDRAHAATALRQAARSTAETALRLPPGDLALLVPALAARTGRRPDDLARLLDDAAPPPATDPELIHLASELAELDREVRRT